MVQIILSEQQTSQILQATSEPVQLCDPQGKVIRVLVPEASHEFIAELKRRAAKPGPRYTGSQIQARLQALQSEWERVGGFDADYMRQFLSKLDQSDPGHMRTVDQAG